MPRTMCMSKDEMLVRLRKTLHKKGHLSARIMDQTPGLPKARTYIVHFGSLVNTPPAKAGGFGLRLKPDMIDPSGRLFKPP